MGQLLACTANVNLGHTQGLDAADAARMQPFVFKQPHQKHFSQTRKMLLNFQEEVASVISTQPTANTSSCLSARSRPSPVHRQAAHLLGYGEVGIDLFSLSSSIVLQSLQQREEAGSAGGPCSRHHYCSPPSIKPLREHKWEESETPSPKVPLAVMHLSV